MNHVKSRLAAAAVVAVVLSGCSMASGDPGSSASTPSTPSMSSAAEASASLDPNDTSAWLPFTSDRYGLSLAYPPDWSANQGNGEWTFPEDTAWPDGIEATDWFYLDDPAGAVAASAWSVALEPGTSADQWWLDYCAVEVTPCDGSETKEAASLDGHAGWLVDASDPAAYFGVGDRIYLLTVWQPDYFAAMEPFGGGLAFIETWLPTMRLPSN